MIRNLIFTGVGAISPGRFMPKVLYPSPPRCLVLPLRAHEYVHRSHCRQAQRGQIHAF